jgi:hypothetical protein
MSKPEIKVVKLRDDWRCRSIDLNLGRFGVNVAQGIGLGNRIWEASRLNWWATGSTRPDEAESMVRLLQVAIRKAKQWNKQRCGKKSVPPKPTGATA